jgi:hypothetical protein
MITTPLRWLSLAVIFGLSSVHAATLANFNFTGDSKANAASPISGITISPLTSDSAFNSFTSVSGWDSAAQISGAAGFFSSPTTHATAGDALSFTITAASGYSFSLDNFSFLARSTATAPADIGFKISSSFYDFSGTYSNNSTITTISNSSLGLTGLTSATLSIQGWNASGSGALQLDNIFLTGSVIPEPSSAVLVILGSVALLRRRR